jgi:hypothetical protein
MQKQMRLNICLLVHKSSQWSKIRKIKIIFVSCLKILVVLQFVAESEIKQERCKHCEETNEVYSEMSPYIEAAEFHMLFLRDITIWALWISYL